MFVKTVVLHAEMQPNLRLRMFLTILMVWCRSKSDDFVAFGIFWAFVNVFCNITICQKRFTLLWHNVRIFVWTKRNVCGFEVGFGGWGLLNGRSCRPSLLIFPVCFRRKHSTILHLSGQQRLNLFLEKIQTHLSNLIQWVALNQITASPKSKISCTSFKDAS